eukprot:1159757-Pelagomonas_calceolata.AAC.1
MKRSATWRMVAASTASMRANSSALGMRRPYTSSSRPMDSATSVHARQRSSIWQSAKKQLRIIAAEAGAASKLTVGGVLEEHEGSLHLVLCARNLRLGGVVAPSAPNPPVQGCLWCSTADKIYRKRPPDTDDRASIYGSRNSHAGHLIHGCISEILTSVPVCNAIHAKQSCISKE